MCQNHSHHDHNHDHSHDHNHAHPHNDHSVSDNTDVITDPTKTNESDRRIIFSKTNVLQENDIFSERIKGYLDAHNVFSLNIMSSPGAGKTTILENTIKHLSDKIDISVIEGDQYTDNDANRIKSLNVQAVQINTGNGCHLESFSVYNALKKIKLQNSGILFIENVGNLVCPAMFNIGEDVKVVVISTTEGVDKPLKYPAVFALSDICIINKTDLLPYLNIDINELESNIRKINSNIKIFKVSCTKEDGLDKWYEYITKCQKSSVI